MVILYEDLRRLQYSNVSTKNAEPSPLMSTRCRRILEMKDSSAILNGLVLMLNSLGESYERGLVPFLLVLARS
jgi:hypothetical protein